MPPVFLSSPCRVGRMRPGKELLAVMLGSSAQLALPRTTSEVHMLGIGAAAHENVILSGPIPDLLQSGQRSEESFVALRTGSREARHGDSSLEVRRHGNWFTGPLRVTAGVIFRTSNLARGTTEIASSL